MSPSASSLPSSLSRAFEKNNVGDGEDAREHEGDGEDEGDSSDVDDSIEIDGDSGGGGDRDRDRDNESGGRQDPDLDEDEGDDGGKDGDNDVYGELEEDEDEDERDDGGEHEDDDWEVTHGDGDDESDDDDEEDVQDAESLSASNGGPDAAITIPPRLARAPRMLDSRTHVRGSSSSADDEPQGTRSPSVKTCRRAARRPAVLALLSSGPSPEIKARSFAKPESTTFHAARPVPTRAALRSGRRASERGARRGLCASRRPLAASVRKTSACGHVGLGSRRSAAILGTACLRPLTYSLYSPPRRNSSTSSARRCTSPVRTLKQ